MLNVLVMIHEFGHFLVAKWTGVKVNEFAIGMGPKLIKWGKGETLYTIRVLPIGGFCAMEGEDEEAPTPAALGGNADREPAETDPRRSFAHKKVWQRILIVLAGPVMNLLLGFVVLLIANGLLQDPHPVHQEVLYPTTYVARLGQDTPPYRSGLRPGDTIIEVNGRRILMYTDLSYEMQKDRDGVLEMVVQRPEGDSYREITLEKVNFTEKDEKTGALIRNQYFYVKGDVRTFWNTVTYSAKQEVSIATMVLRSVVDLIKGEFGMSDLSGPVGTVDIIGDTMAGAVEESDSLAGWYNLFFLMGLITVNLGVFNLLPLPALDGGRLVFLIWEGITRKPVPAKYEALVHFGGMILLLLLMLVVTYSDVTRLFA